jgi:hypothetical protein
MRRISMATRDELVAAIAERYSRADKTERSRILDEFTAVTGFHRKHAMRLLRAGQPNRRSGPRPARRIYDDATREALIVIWEASDRICGKRLRPLVPVLVEAMERHGHLHLAPAVRISLLAMSAATIDRALRPIRQQAGRSHSGPSPGPIYRSAQAGMPSFGRARRARGFNCRDQSQVNVVASASQGAQQLQGGIADYGAVTCPRK